MNTKKSTLLLLCAFGLTFCASAGAATYFATAETSGTEPTGPVLTMTTGASIRISEPGGIRFESSLSRDNYDALIAKDAEFFTAILPQTLVPQEGITASNLATCDAEIVKAVNSIEVGEQTVTFSGVLAGLSNGDGTYQPLPEVAYTMPFYAVSYYTYKEGENTVTEFANNPQTYSIAYIASVLQAQGYKNKYYTKITDYALPDGISFGDTSYTVHADATIETTLDANGLKAKYTSNDESVATVDENGVVTGVGKGTAIITATIGNKTDTVDVTVNSIFGNNPTYSTGFKAFTESVDANGNVTFTSERYGEVSATFDTAASKQYYAEATFNLVRRTDGSYPAFGLAHFKSVNPIVNETGDAYNDAGARFGRSGWLSVKSGSSATYLVGSVTEANNHWYDATVMYKNTKFRDNGTFSTMKIAIARSGSTVYTFVDGKLIHLGDIPWDDVTAGTLTTPGIIVSGGPNEVTAKDINVLSGSDAQTKINSVLSQTSVLGNNPTYPTYGIKTYNEYLGDDGDVEIQSGRNGELAATFNTEASTLYYAEATFPWLKQDTDGNYTAFGLAHFKSLNTVVNETGNEFNNAGDRYGRECVISAKSGTSNTFIVGTLTASQQHWYESTALFKNPNFAAKGTPMKIAIARTDTMMYTFVDDKLVYSCEVPEGYSAATTPGIITIGNSYSFTISKLKVLSGSAAQAKITELTTATNNA